MRGGATEVEAFDRRARRQPVLPHLVRRDLALEDVALREPDALLDVRRPEHLVTLDEAGEIGREAGDQVDELLGDLVAAGRPAQLVRGALAGYTPPAAVPRGGGGGV